MRVVELCAGIGGFSLAAEWMGWQVAGHVEIDPFCARVLIAPNAVWPRLAGRVGVVVHMTPANRPCGDQMNWRTRVGRRCGGNPVVLVDGQKWLVPRDAVTVFEDVGMVA